MKNVGNIRVIYNKVVDNMSRILYIFQGLLNIAMRGVNMATEKEKAERFKRVAENRTNKIIDQIRLLGNCSNRSNYDYSEDEIKRIFSAIESELKETKSKFQQSNKSKKFEL